MYQRPRATARRISSSLVKSLFLKNSSLARRRTSSSPPGYTWPTVITRRYRSRTSGCMGGLHSGERDWCAEHRIQGQDAEQDACVRVCVLPCCGGVSLVCAQMIGWFGRGDAPHTCPCCLAASLAGWVHRLHFMTCPALHGRVPAHVLLGFSSTHPRVDMFARTVSGQVVPGAPACMGPLPSPPHTMLCCVADAEQDDMSLRTEDLVTRMQAHDSDRSNSNLNCRCRCCAPSTLAAPSQRATSLLLHLATTLPSCNCKVRVVQYGSRTRAMLSCDRLGEA